MSTRKTPVGEILDELTAAQARHNRLPKWAQHEIELLTRRLGEANDKIAELTANDPTRVLLDVSGMGSPERYLPDDSRVRFLLAGDDVWRNFIDVSLDRHMATADGTIDASLFVAGQRAGLSNKIIMQMVTSTSVVTRVLVADGWTLMLGGMISETRRTDIVGIPIQ